MWTSQNGEAKCHSYLLLECTVWSLASNGGFSFHFYIVENESRFPDRTPSYVDGN